MNKSICSWCGEVIIDGKEPISHGICKDCHDDILIEIEESE